MSLKVSIVIPCYNCEKVVGRAIKSVLNQSFSNWELILVNNNSTDNTKEILHYYQKKHPDKISLVDEMTPGAPYARNRGLFNAKGTWMQFLDADDELLQNKIKTQVDFGENGNLDVIIGRFYRVLYIKGKMFKFLKPIKNESELWEGLLTGKLGITSSNLYKKDALIDVNGWKYIIGSQETELLFRLMTNGKKIGIHKGTPLTKVYYESGSITRNSNKNKNKQILNQYLNIRHEIKEYLIQNGLYNEKLDRKYSLTLYSYVLSKRNILKLDLRNILKDYNMHVGPLDKIVLIIKNWLKTNIKPIS